MDGVHKDYDRTRSFSRHDGEAKGTTCGAREYGSCSQTRLSGVYQVQRNAWRRVWKKEKKPPQVAMRPRPSQKHTAVS